VEAGREQWGGGVSAYAVKGHEEGVARLNLSVCGGAEPLCGPGREAGYCIWAEGAVTVTCANSSMYCASVCVQWQVLEELSPYVDLGEKLGRLAIQLVAEGGIKDIKLTYKTARSGDDLDTRLLRAMVLKGLIEPVSNSVLNLVNADYIAKQRGIRVSEEKQPSEGGDESLPLESIQIQLFQVSQESPSPGCHCNCSAAEFERLPHWNKGPEVVVFKHQEQSGWTGEGTPARVITEALMSGSW